MALIETLDSGSVRVYIWSVTETEKELLKLAKLSTDDEAKYKSFSGIAVGRRKEWLAVRALVRQVIDDDVCIVYGENGAPKLKNRKLEISISHTTGYAAVAISYDVCGLDIELKSRNFDAVKKRTLSEMEVDKILDALSRKYNDSNLATGVLWCAKEVIYKACGRTNIDFANDIRIIIDKDGFLNGILEQDRLVLKVVLTKELIIVYNM